MVVHTFVWVIVKGTPGGSPIAEQTVTGEIVGAGGTNKGPVIAGEPLIAEESLTG